MPVSRHSLTSSATVGILVVALPFLTWRVFFSEVPLTGSGEAALSVQFDEAFTSSPMPSQERARLRELFSTPIHSLTITGNGSEARFYEEGTGRTFAVDLKSLRSEPISEGRLENLLEAWWSPSGTEVIAAFGEEGGASLRFFDFTDGKVSILPHTVRAFAFSPDGRRLVTLHEESGTSRIMVSERDGTNPWILTRTRLSVISISWPHPERIILHTADKEGTHAVHSLDLSGTLSALFEKAYELEMVWSPSGDQAILSHQDREGVLHTVLIEDQGNTLEKLPFRVSASKCAWSLNGRTLGCGIPSQTSAGDTVMTYRIGDTEPILRYQPPKEAFITVTKPRFISNGLVFVNGYDKRPYLVSW